MTILMVFKTLHILAALASFTLFSLRSYWKLIASSQLKQRWIKILPHIVDTVLLGTAVVMMVLIHQYPFADHWLTVKLVVLIIYILQGLAVLKFARNRSTIVVTWAVAQVLFFYIVAVALTHHPMPWQLLI